MRLSDEPVALVTGSGSPRVGRVIVERLIERGYSIGLHARELSDEVNRYVTELENRGVRHQLLLGDLNDVEVCSGMVADVVDTFGRLDVLVNSAAIWHPTVLEEIKPAELRRYFDVNAVATFLTARAAGLQMVRQETGGAIVNISDWALARPYLHHAAYFPSKGAVEAITKSLAVELGYRNPKVRVNSIAPGPVMMQDDVDDNRIAALAQSTLVRRVGTPEHVAHAVQFLIENEFVTGICLPVDGGRSIFANDGLQTGLGTG